MWFLKILLLVSSVGMIQDYVLKDRPQEKRIHLIKIVDNENGQKENEKIPALMIVRKINLNLISKALTPD